MQGMSAGDLYSKMLLDIDPYMKEMDKVSKKATQTLNKVNKTWKEGSKRITTSTSAEMKKITQSWDEGGKRISATWTSAADKVQKSWWDTFGRVALGFTIMYRAMRAAEEGLRQLIGTFEKGREAIDEYRMSVIEVAASLQMLSELPSTEGLDEYYKFASVVFQNLEIIAIKHFSTAEDLRSAYAKLATMGIVPQTEVQLEQMARLVDLIIIQTRGLDKQRQIRTEIQALVKGEMRQGAVVARMAKERVDNYDAMILSLEEESNVIARTNILFDATNKILSDVGSVSEGIMNTHTAWFASIEMIFDKVARVGLLKMYEDMLSVLRGIAGSLVDQNGLTEKGLLIAYAYNATWEIVYATVKSVYDVFVELPLGLSAWTWSLHKLAFAAKIAAASFLTLVVAIRTFKKLALFQFDITELSEDVWEYGQALESLFESSEEFTARFNAQVMKSLKEFRKSMKELTTGSKTAEEEISDVLEKISKKTAKLVTDYESSRRAFKAATAKGYFDEKVFKQFKEIYEAYEGFSEISAIALTGIKISSEDLEALTEYVDMTRRFAALNEKIEKAKADIKLELETENLKRSLEITKEMTQEVISQDYLMEGELEYKEKIAKFLAQAAKLEGQVSKEILEAYINQGLLNLAAERHLALVKKDKIELGKLGKAMAEETKYIAMSLEEQQDAIDDILSDDAWTVKQLTAVRSMYEDMGLAGQEYQDVVFDLIDAQAEKYKKMFKDTADIGVVIDKWALNEKTKFKNSILSTVKGMYEDMGIFGKDYNDIVLQLLKAEGERYEEMTDGKITAEEYVANELEKIERAKRDMVLDTVQGTMANMATLAEYLVEHHKSGYKLYKAFAKAAAIVAAIQSAINAYNSAAVIPAVGWILAPIAAAAAMLAGMTNVAKIEDTEPKNYALGGWLDRHPGGGTVDEGTVGKDDVLLGVSGGKSHWAMRDEVVFVMNKEAAKRNKQLLEAWNNRRNYQGGGEIGGGWEHEDVTGIGFGPGAGGYVGPGYVGGGTDADQVTGGYSGQYPAGGISYGVDIPGLEEWAGAAFGLTGPGIPSIEEWISDYNDLVIAWENINEAILENAVALTELDEKLLEVDEKFDIWHDQLVDLKATEEMLQAVEDKRADAIAALTREMRAAVWEDVTEDFRDLLGISNDLDIALARANKDYNDLVDQLKEVNLSEEEMLAHLIELGIATEDMTSMEKVLAAIRDRVIDEMQSNFIDPLEDIIAEGTLTDVGYQLRNLNLDYAEQALEAEMLARDTEELIALMGLLDEAYGIQLEVIKESVMELTQAVIDEHTLDEFERARKEADSWYKDRMTEWADLRATMSEEEYIQGMADIAEAFGYMLDDIEADVTDAATKIEEGFRDSIDSIRGEAQNIIDEHTLSEIELSRREINQWYQDQVDAWKDLSDQMSSSEYMEGLTALFLAWQMLLDDLVKETRDAAKELGIGLGQQISAFIDPLTEYEKELAAIEKEYRDTLSQIAEWQAITGEDYDDLIAQASILRGLQIDALNAELQAAYEEELAAWEADRVQEKLIDNLEEQLEIAQDIEAVLEQWKQIYDSLVDQILALRTGMASPADAIERLNILKTAIEEMTGGLSAAGYVSTLGTAEEMSQTISILQDYFGQYLDLAAEAYQRPSLEYQQIYEDTLGELVALEKFMRDYSIKTFDVDIAQLDVLKDIRDAIADLEFEISIVTTPEAIPPPKPEEPEEIIEIPWVGTDIMLDWSRWWVKEVGEEMKWLDGVIERVSDFVSIYTSYAMGEEYGKQYVLELYDDLMELANEIPGLLDLWTEAYGAPFQTGVNYIPETGFYKLHEGERVTSSGADAPLTFDIHFHGDVDRGMARDAGIAFIDFLKGPEARIVIQETVRGRS